MKGLVLGAYADDSNIKLTPTADKFNAATNGQLLKQLNVCKEGFKKGKTRIFYDLQPDFPLVAVSCLGKEGEGCNENEELDEGRENVRLASACGCKGLQELGATHILVESLNCAEPAAEGAALAVWKYQQFKAKPKPIPEIELYCGDATNKADWERGMLAANSQNFARLLMDTPANHMTPTIFAQTVEKKLAANGVEVTIRDKEWAESKKMGSFLSVTRGSEEPPVFLELAYRGAGSSDKPVVLIGKGITFDSGGISLKPPGNMDNMRGDMGGAACVVATINAVSAMKLPINVQGLVPLCENLPSGKATKPGDVVVAMNGKSICVDNTDAEGRLVLADALCYSKEFDPKFVIDLATLTGAIGVALGAGAAGVFSNSTRLWQKLQAAGAYTGDRVWRMPLWNYYSSLVSDNSAYDVNNIGKPNSGAGPCTAAAFLKEFAPNVEWMHLDIAGVMNALPGDSMPYLGTKMTGRPTRTLIKFLSDTSCS